MLIFLLMVVAPAITGAVAGQSKGYLWQGLAAGLFVTWLGVVAVLFWLPRQS